MTPTPPALAYRRAATQQASIVGLVIALYDTLAGDLHRAIAAMDRNDIEDRSRHLKHGFAVLTQLDSLVDIERGGQTATNLRRFYSYIREEMLRAQFARDAQILERISTLLLDVRGAWQQVDMRATRETSAAFTDVASDLSVQDRAPLNCLA